MRSARPRYCLCIELAHRGSRNGAVLVSLKKGYCFFLSLGEGVGTHKGETRQRGGPTSEFTAAGPAREARSQKLSCGQNERKRSSDRTPSDLARDECSSRRVSFGVRSCLSARRRSDCKRRFVFALVGGFDAADLGFWFSFRRAGLLLLVLFAALGVIAESLRAESCFASWVCSQGPAQR